MKKLLLLLSTLLITACAPGYYAYSPGVSVGIGYTGYYQPRPYTNYMPYYRNQPYYGGGYYGRGYGGGYRYQPRHRR